jgi:hypothetical protein
MASGVYADTAPVLYFTNLNYNDTDVPKSSYVNETCAIPILNNASNYEVAINKLKISDLSGIVMGYLPYNEFQVGLQLEDSAGTIHFEQANVAFPNTNPITATYQYIASCNSNYSITLYQYQGSTQTSIENTFTPENSFGDPIIPQYVVYDSQLSNFIVASFNAIYVYDSAGLLLDSQNITNIVNAYYSTIAQALIVCVNLPTPTVYSYRVVSNALVQQWAITDSRTLGALTNIACASTDGQNVLVCWYYSGNPYATIYDYLGQAAENEGPLPNTLLNISSCVISSSDGSFIVSNNQYDPTLGMGANIDLASPFNNWNIYGVNPYVEKCATADNITSLMVNDGSSFAFGVNVTAPYTYQNAGWPNNWVQFTAGLIPGAVPGTLQTSVSYYNPNLCIGLGFTPNNVFNPTSAELNYINAGGVWINFYNIPSLTVLPDGQISVSPDGYVFATYGLALYVLSNPITLTGTSPNQIPTLPAGTDWVQVVSNETNPQITSLIWDDYLPNVGYALVATTNNICKVVVNLSNNTYSLREWHLTVNTFASYITKAINYNYNLGSTINKFSMQSFSTLDTKTFGATYISNLALSRLEDYLYIVSESNNAISIYDYRLLTTLGLTITGISPTGIAGVFTSTETILPTQSQLAFYDLQQVVDAVNAAYLLCYAALEAAITGVFPVGSCPYWVLDFTTKRLTLNYDPKFETEAGNGIYVNSDLLQYFKLPTVAGDQTGYRQYVLSPSGSSTQTQETIFKLIFVDKIIIKTNMTLLSDFENGSNTKYNQVFTDLDIDTSDQFFNLDGSFLYSAILLRNYVLTSNSQLRGISYQIWVQYKDGSELPYQIPVGENVSIKFQFSRLY